MVSREFRFDDGDREAVIMRVLIRDILKYKKMVISVFLLCVIVSLLFSLSIPPTFRTVALVDVGQSKFNLDDVQFYNMPKSNPFLEAKASEVQLTLIKSRYILKSVIDKLHLDIALKPVLMPVLGRLLYRNDDKAVAEPFLGFTQYAWGGEQVNVEQLTVPKHINSVKLKYLGNRKYELYNLANQRLLSGLIGQTVTGQLSSDARIEIAISSIKANPGTQFFLKKMSYDESIRQVLSHFKVKEVGKNTGLLKLIYTDSNPEGMQTFINTVIKTVLDKDRERKIATTNNSLKHLRQQLKLVKSTLNQQGTTLADVQTSEQTPDVKTKTSYLYLQVTNLEKELTNIRSQVVELEGTYTNNYPAVKQMQRKEKEVMREMERLKSQIRRLPNAGRKVLGISKGIEANQKLYSFLVSQIQQLEAVIQSYASPIHVLEYASRPEEIPTVARYFSIFLGFLAGIFLAFVSVIIRKQLTTSEIEEYEIRQTLSADAEFIEHITSHTKELTDDRPLFNLDDVATLSIEDFKSLRTRLHMIFSRQETNLAKFMGIELGVGRSFIISNLAGLFAKSQKKTLLIDFDISAGKVHKYYGLRQSPGVAELIGKDLELDGIVKPCNEYLDIIPCGSSDGDASDILMSPKVDIILDLLSQCYDVVLISSPALNHSAEGEIIAAKDGVNVLVVEETTETISSAQKAMEALRKNEILMDLVLLNKKNK